MGSSKNNPIDHQRYFNDPEYRKRILKERENSDTVNANDNNRKSGLTKNLYGYRHFLFIGFLGTSGYLFFIPRITKY